MALLSLGIKGFRLGILGFGKMACPISGRAYAVMDLEYFSPPSSGLQHFSHFGVDVRVQDFASADSGSPKLCAATFYVHAHKK